MLKFELGKKYVCIKTLESDFRNFNLYDVGHIYECVRCDNISDSFCMKDNANNSRVLLERNEKYFIPEEYASFVDDILDLKKVKNSRLGFYEFKIPMQIINNSLTFLGTLVRNGIEIKETLEIRPSNFYTVCFDFNTNRVNEGLVSVEIGKTMLGWFTDWDHGINTESDGIKTDFLEIPPALKEELSRL